MSALIMPPMFRCYYCIHHIMQDSGRVGLIKCKVKAPVSIRRTLINQEHDGVFHPADLENIECKLYVKTVYATCSEQILSFLTDAV